VQPHAVGVDHFIDHRFRQRDAGGNFRQLAFAQQLSVGIAPAAVGGTQANTNKFTRYGQSTAKNGQRQNHFEQR
jgi:hypothetical protein